MKNRTLTLLLVACYACRQISLPSPPTSALSCQAYFDDCIIHTLYQGECVSMGCTLENIEVDEYAIRVYASEPIVQVKSLLLGNDCPVPEAWLSWQQIQPDGSCHIPLSEEFYEECYLAFVQEHGFAQWDAGLIFACGE